MWLHACMWLSAYMWLHAYPLMIDHSPTTYKLLPATYYPPSTIYDPLPIAVIAATTAAHTRSSPYNAQTKSPYNAVQCLPYNANMNDYECMYMYVCIYIHIYASVDGARAAAHGPRAAAHGQAAAHDCHAYITPYIYI